jgi:adenylate cyclase
VINKVEEDRERAFDATTTEQWRRLLTGEDAGLKRLRRRWQNLPAPPRCKVCAAPFNLPGSLLTRAILHGRSNANPLVCNACFGTLRTHPGGAEVEISVMFTDVRGSTAIAERTGAVQFRRLVQHFYDVVVRAIERNGGIVDKLLGDGVMALFIPMTAGAEHAAKAIAAGRELIDREAGDHQLVEANVRFGVGLHTGPAFVGVLGAGEKLDFSALGDTVNAAARLGSLARPGELLVSWAAWERSGLPVEGLERRTVEVAGRREPLDIVALRSASTAPTASAA